MTRFSNPSQKPPRSGGGAVTEHGHNSGALDGGHLKAFIERVENLEAEKKAIADDISEVYKEARGNGYDPKIMRRIVALRKKTADALAEESELTRLYAESIGMQYSLL